MNWLLWLLAIALASYSVYGVGTAAVDAGAHANRVSRNAVRAAEDDVTPDEWTQIQKDARSGTLKQVGAVAKGDLSAQTIWSPGVDKNPIVIGFGEGMSLSELAIDADENTRQKKAARKTTWVIWMDEGMGWQPLYANTVQEFENKKKDAYARSGEGAAPVPEYSVVMGPYETREQALDAVAAELRNVRTLPGGPGAVYGGLVVGDLKGAPHAFFELGLPAEKLNWAEGQGPSAPAP